MLPVGIVVYTLDHTNIGQVGPGTTVTDIVPIYNILRATDSVDFAATGKIGYPPASPRSKTLPGFRLTV